MNLVFLESFYCQSLKVMEVLEVASRAEVCKQEAVPDVKSEEAGAEEIQAVREPANVGDEGSLGISGRPPEDNFEEAVPILKASIIVDPLVGACGLFLLFFSLTKENW